MTRKQPILDELYAVREQLLVESGGTLAGLVARLKAEQENSGRVIIKSRQVEQQNGKSNSVDLSAQTPPTGLYSMPD
jgi:hypothetical protein